MPANARVYVTFLSGKAIGFCTGTDNLTNDPTLVVDTPAELLDTVSWGVQGEVPASRTVQQH